MEYAETRIEAVSAAQQAMDSMSRLGIPPHPDNFTLWYAHHSRHLPDLSREIIRLVETGSDFAPQIIRDLQERFFGQAEENRTLADASQRMKTTLNHLLRMLGVANQGTESYGATLADLSDRAETADGGSMREIIGVLVTETRKTLEISHELSRQLNKSAQEVRQLRNDLDRVRQEAHTDGLTGVANRKRFDRVLLKATLDAQQHSSHLSLLMLDIDLFKRFNDTYGHPMGDQVLKLVVRTIETCLRQDDTVARYGGEEFAAILPGVPLRTALDAAERIRASIAKKHITNRRTRTEMGRITLSIGVSEFALGESVDRLIQRADKALYLAKRSGRNRVMSQMDLDLAAC